MGKYCISVGRLKSPQKNFNINKLCLVGNSFSTVFFKKVQATAISVVKGFAPYIVGKDNIAVIQNTNGDMYYYHPKYHRWYKNLSENSLRKYFSWLFP